MLQTLQNILYGTSDILYLKHVMLKTSVPVKFLLTALASFCKDKGGRTENFYISFCTLHPVSPLSNFSKIY